MSNRFYSQETGTTYIQGIHEIPADAVLISKERYLSVIANPAHGKIRSHDAEGLPILIDPPPPTREQLADTARAERDRRIESVRWRIERHKDELALGSEPTEQLEPLLQYTQALRDVPQQTWFPESVEWPQCP